MKNPQPWWLTWPVAEVAAAILPHFSAALSMREAEAIDNIVSWCRTGSYGEKFAAEVQQYAERRYKDPDARAVAEAVQVLEHAGLLMRTVVPSTSYAVVLVGLTRLGHHALATNTVRQHLGLGDAMPTANPGGSGSE